MTPNHFWFLIRQNHLQTKPASQPALEKCSLQKINRLEHHRLVLVSRAYSLLTEEIGLEASEA